MEVVYIYGIYLKRHYFTTHLYILKLNIADCPYGYDVLSESCACVKHIPGSYMTWINSRQDCVNLGADLPVLNSDNLFTEFLDYMDNTLNLGK